MTYCYSSCDFVRVNPKGFDPIIRVTVCTNHQHSPSFPDGRHARERSKMPICNDGPSRIGRVSSLDQSITIPPKEFQQNYHNQNALFL